jgi:NAD(P)-dependent dehydrogenase (short-subunit alcohol dehydrogenase family)
MTEQYSDKNPMRVVITAGASGLGHAVAQRFISSGASVWICDSDARALAQFCEEFPGQRANQVDVSQADQVNAWFDEILGDWGKLDCLVNNAGIAGPTAPVEEISPEDWDLTLAVDLGGAFYCARRAVPLLRAAGGGSIINISSSAALSGYPNRAPYAAAKWGLIGFTKTLAMELGPENIRVNALCPGSIEGPRIDRVIEREAQVSGVSPEQVRECYLKQTSLRRFTKPSEVAEMILYLCSAPGSIMSGQAIGMDGHTESLSAWHKTK